MLGVIFWSLTTLLFISPRRAFPLYRSKQCFTSSTLIISLKPRLIEEYHIPFSGFCVGFCFPMRWIFTTLKHRKLEQVLTLIFCAQLECLGKLDFHKVWKFLLSWAAHSFIVSLQLVWFLVEIRGVRAGVVWSEERKNNSFKPIRSKGKTNKQTKSLKGKIWL